MNIYTRAREQISVNWKNRSGIIATTGLLVGLSLVSRIVGLVRDRLLTSQFGVGGILDSYFSAFRIPDLIYNILILGTLSSAFIPIFSRLIHREDPKQAQELVDDLLLILAIVMGCIGLLMSFGAPWLTRIVALSYEGQKFTDTVTLTRIMAFSPLIFSLSSVLSSILHTYKKFIFVALAPILYNVGIIIGILVLYPYFGVPGLGYGVLLGALFHLLIQIPSVMKVDFQFSFSFGMNWKNLKRLWKLYWPRLLVIDTSMITMFIGTVVASAEASAVTVYSLAFNLNALPLGVFAISFVTTIFPYLTESFAKEDEDAFRKYLTVTISRIVYVLIPVTVLMLNYRAQLVRIVYGGGQFSWDDTRLTVATFTLFAVSIPFQGLIPLFSRALYARHDTITPMVIGILGMIFNAVASVILLQWYGVEGVAIAFSLTMVLICLTYASVVFQRVNHGTVMKTLMYGLQVGLISLVMVGISFVSKSVFAIFYTTNTTLGLISQVMVSSMPGVIFYALVTWKIGLTKKLKVSDLKK